MTFPRVQTGSWCCSSACSAVVEFSSSESQNLLVRTDLCFSAQDPAEAEHTPKKLNTTWLAVSRPSAVFVAETTIYVTLADPVTSGFDEVLAKPQRRTHELSEDIPNLTALGKPQTVKKT